MMVKVFIYLEMEEIKKKSKVYFLITYIYGVNINHKIELLNLNVQGTYTIKSICLVGPVSFVL